MELVDSHLRSGIYRIVNTSNGHQYIGSSVDMRRRWAVHRNALKNNKHHSAHLQNAWNKYRETAFIFEVLEHWEKDVLIGMEQWWINHVKPEYNIRTKAEGGIGRSWTKEERLRISGRLKGHVVTPETREKLRMAHTGKKHPNRKPCKSRRKVTEILRQKLRAAAHRRSPETLCKIALSKCKTVVNTHGEIFPSVAAAAECYNRCASAISGAIKRGRPSAGCFWRFCNEKKSQ